MSPGIIHNQIINSIIDFPISIVDLSFQNPNVFYELALRHCVRKPCILLIKDNEPIPFDVGNNRVIMINENNTDTAKNTLEGQIRDIQSNYQEYENPISVVFKQRDISIFTGEFDEYLQLSFADTGSDTIELNYFESFIPFSYREEKVVKEILKKKQEEQKKKQEERQKQIEQMAGSPIGLQLMGLSDLPQYSLENALHPFGGLQPVPYEDRSIDELNNLLENIHKIYRDEDLHEFFEVHAQKIQIILSNTGTKYIEDCSIEMEIPKIEGLFIPDHIYSKPERNSFPAALYSIAGSGFGYPDVEEECSKIKINTHLGDVKHHIPKELFGLPLRMALAKAAEGKTIEIKCKIFGKQIPKYIERTLFIKVTPPVK